MLTIYLTSVPGPSSFTLFIWKIFHILGILLIRYMYNVLVAQSEGHTALISFPKRAKGLKVTLFLLIYLLNHDFLHPLSNIFFKISAYMEPVSLFGGAASLQIGLPVCLSARLFQLASGEGSLTILTSTIVGEYRIGFNNYPGPKNGQCHTQTV